jgi:Cu-Zn family superoxide dismutase
MMPIFIQSRGSIMYKNSTIHLLLLILFPIALMTCSDIGENADKIDSSDRATVVLHSLTDDPVSGMVSFHQEFEGLKITIDINGLTPGKHGIHLHEFGSYEIMDSVLASKIYDPLDKPHGGPADRESQFGDWGNITADENGHASKEWIDIDLSLDGPYSVIGRSVVVHESEDDMITEPAGGSGAAIAAGTVGWSKPTDNK